MKFKNLLCVTTATLLTLVLSGCDYDQPVEVYLPPDGDPVTGKQLFVSFGCYECHSIPNIEFPERTSEPAKEFMLGIRLHRVKNYGELMTAILYPNHEYSPKFESALRAEGKDSSDLVMPVFTEVMTVAELVDILAFLDEQYSENMGQYRGKGE